MVHELHLNKLLFFKNNYCTRYFDDKCQKEEFQVTVLFPSCVVGRLKIYGKGVFELSGF